jgi:hypothetical protein
LIEKNGIHVSKYPVEGLSKGFFVLNSGPPIKELDAYP